MKSSVRQVPKLSFELCQGIAASHLFLAKPVNRKPCEDIPFLKLIRGNLELLLVRFFMVKNKHMRRICMFGCLAEPSKSNSKS